MLRVIPRFDIILWLSWKYYFRHITIMTIDAETLKCMASQSLSTLVIGHGYFSYFTLLSAACAWKLFLSVSCILIARFTWWIYVASFIEIDLRKDIASILTKRHHGVDGHSMAGNLHLIIRRRRHRHVSRRLTKLMPRQHGHFECRYLMLKCLISSKVSIGFYSEMSFRRPHRNAHFVMTI